MEHGKSRLHWVAVTLWESGGAATMVIGGPPLPVRAAILHLFHLVYRLVKLYGVFTDLAADAPTTTMVGGAMAPTDHSPLAAHKILYSIAAPICAARGGHVRHAVFFALAPDNSTDCSADKQELVYMCTVCTGRSCTFFVALRDLQAGTVIAILGVLLRGARASMCISGHQ